MVNRWTLLAWPCCPPLLLALAMWPAASLQLLQPHIPHVLTAADVTLLAAADSLAAEEAQTDVYRLCHDTLVHVVAVHVSRLEDTETWEAWVMEHAHAEDCL